MFLFLCLIGLMSLSLSVNSATGYRRSLLQELSSGLPAKSVRRVIFRFAKIFMGQDNVVGIATRYLLDGPGFGSRWGRDFSRLSRLALGPIQSLLR